MIQRSLRLMCGVLLLFVTVGAQTRAGLEGTWKGTLATGGAGLRIVLQVSKAADGLYTGSLESLDQGSTIPIDRITVTGDMVRLELKAVNGTFEGTLNAARTELKGTWSQGGAIPLVLTRETGPPTATGPPGAAATATPAAFPLGLPLDLDVPVAPMVFVGGDGRTYLVHELHITNFGSRELVLKRIDVLNGAAVIAGYEGTDLNSLLGLPGSGPATDRRTIPPGRRSVAFLWIELDPAGLAPASLGHRVTIGDLSVDSAPVAVPAQKPIAIGPPLKGVDWLAANGPGRDSGHRRALIPVGGRAHIAQRFAIDFVQMGSNGQSFTGDAKDNRSYRAYGAEVLAVGDGVVAATKDGIPENVPGLASRAVPITLDTVGGNYVVLDLSSAASAGSAGSGRFAFYAHLQPGSLRVKVGQRVTRGQVIGLVGNSGNSTEPHLHFHISNGVSPLGSEGLPYAAAGMTGMPLQNARVNFGK